MPKLCVIPSTTVDVEEKNNKNDTSKKSLFDIPKSQNYEIQVPVVSRQRSHSFSSLDNILSSPPVPPPKKDILCNSTKRATLSGTDMLSLISSSGVNDKKKVARRSLNISKIDPVYSNNASKEPILSDRISILPPLLPKLGNNHHTESKSSLKASGMASLKDDVISLLNRPSTAITNSLLPSFSRQRSKSVNLGSGKDSSFLPKIKPENSILDILYIFLLLYY